MKFKESLAISISLLFITVIPAFAHVVVKPNTVNVGEFQTFTMGVPTEKDNPTIGLRLLIPNGVKFVTPNVKSGWTISTKQSGSGDNAAVSEIDWTGGSIPPEQRDEFSFNAQVPTTQTTLVWKAYQQYQNGDVVEWTHTPSKSDDDDTNPPYSTTSVKNDLTGNNQAQPSHDDTGSIRLISYAALALSLVAISIQRMKKDNVMYHLSKGWQYCHPLRIISTVVKKLIISFLILIGIFVRYPQKISAHLAGQPPFFLVNGKYSGFYPVYVTSLKNYTLPQDTAPEM